VSLILQCLHSGSHNLTAAVQAAVAGSTVTLSENMQQLFERGDIEAAAHLVQQQFGELNYSLKFPLRRSTPAYPWLDSLQHSA